MEKSIKTKNHFIGNGYPCYIIAEMSANHAGSIDNAKEIIKAAKASGADCIKIQTYTPDTMTIQCDNEYFRINKGTWAGETLYELYQQAYTPWEWQKELKEQAEKIGLDFLSTPFDKTSVDFLEDIGIGFYKIASFELTDIPLIKYIAEKQKPIIMSTGMGSLAEIEEAVNTVRGYNNDNICLLKCSSAYPAVYQDLNLETIKHLQQTFDVICGFSDHSLGSVSSVTAVAMGAKIIEKHFCISRKIKNPDSSFSMEPNEFKKMVADIRSTEECIGKVDYSLSEREILNKNFRRSIFAIKDINKDEVFNDNNIAVIRPGFGLPPKDYDNIIGKKATMFIKRGTPLKWEMIF